MPATDPAIVAMMVILSLDNPPPPPPPLDVGPLRVAVVVGAGWSAERVLPGVAVYVEDTCQLPASCGTSTC